MAVTCTRVLQEGLRGRDNLFLATFWDSNFKKLSRFLILSTLLYKNSSLLGQALNYSENLQTTNHCAPTTCGATKLLAPTFRVFARKPAYWRARSRHPIALNPRPPVQAKPTKLGEREGEYRSSICSLEAIVPWGPIIANRGLVSRATETS